MTASLNCMVMSVGGFCWNSDISFDIFLSSVLPDLFVHIVAAQSWIPWYDRGSCDPGCRASGMWVSFAAMVCR